MEKHTVFSEDEIVHQIKEGRTELTDQIMEKYKNLVRKKARALYLMGGDNDDLMQEGMIGLFKAVRDFEPEYQASFAAFAEICISRQLYSAIQASNRKKHSPLNSYISLYSGTIGKDRREVPLQEILPAAQMDNPEELVISRENARRLEAELKKRLSSFECRVLECYLEGRDYVEIAGQLGKSPKSIDNALQRIRRKVQGL